LGHIFLWMDSFILISVERCKGSGHQCNVDVTHLDRDRFRLKILTVLALFKNNISRCSMWSSQAQLCASSVSSV
jgi:hypothetical protein